MDGHELSQFVTFGVLACLCCYSFNNSCLPVLHSAVAFQSHARSIYELIVHFPTMQERDDHPVYGAPWLSFTNWSLLHACPGIYVGIATH